MIAIERTTIDDPRLLIRAHEARAKLIEQFRASQRRLDFDDAIYRAFRPYLQRIFANKCAYCESPVGHVAFGEVNHFRPKASVKEDPVFPGYYWLTYEWNNLLLSCQQCTLSKRNRFPITGRRADSPEDDLAAEAPLLLDPCSDDPAPHLLFADEGYCSGMTERGRATVEILSLNRAPLVLQRREEAERFKTEFTLAVQSKERIEQAISSSRPYAAMRRQIAVRLINEWQNIGFAGPVPNTGNTPLFSDDIVEQGINIVKQHEEAKRSFSINRSSSEDRALFQQGFKGIEHIEIRNFKGIRSLDLSFPPASDRGPWLMFVGENATGKSSILKAVALTLIGQEYADQLNLNKKSLVNYEAADRDEHCEVTVHLVGVGPIRLSFGVDSERLSVDPPQPKILLAGYGATRLLPHIPEPGAPTRYIRIKNLFDPTSPLNDVAQWLIELKRTKSAMLNDFHESVMRLFPEIQELIVENDDVLVKLDDRKIYLHDLSDGFQSLIALLGDIAITVSDFWSSLKIAEGLVLLDEIEVHMHPRWKINIVDRLRAACPQLAFVVTTHDPLCLKGLDNDEIAVLRRDRLGGVTLERNTLSVTHLRWDQILSSFLFNLPSSRSSSAAGLVARYSHLLGKEDRTVEEQVEMNQLRSEVKKQFSSSMTPMQRNVEEAVAQTLRAGSLEDPEREDVRLELRRQVREIIDKDPQAS